MSCRDSMPQRPSVRALVLDGPSQVRLECRPAVDLAPGQVRVRVHSAGICGSDVHGYIGRNARRPPGTVMGHEACGELVAVSNEVAVNEVAIGTQVAINPAVTCGSCHACLAGRDHLCPRRRLFGCAQELPGAFADEIVVDHRSIVPLSPDAPAEWGALVEPLSVGTHAVSLLRDTVVRSLLVLGGGMIGVGVALAARIAGLERLVVAEPLPSRRQVLAHLGIETVEPDACTSDGASFDAAVDCVASPESLDMAMRAVRSSAQVIMVGFGAPAIALPVEPLVVGERVVRGSFNYTHAEFVATAAWVSSGQIDLSPVIQERIDLPELPRVLAEYAEGRREALKTLVQPASGGDVRAGASARFPQASADARRAA